MNEEIYYIPTWVLSLAALTLTTVGSEVGRRIGRRHPKMDASSQATADAIQTSLLAMLALLLAFTLSMSLSRFEQRRAVMAEEANAVGTVYMRAAFLPEPPRTKVRAMLTEYAKSRVVFFETPPSAAPPPNGENLRSRIWDAVAEVAEAEPRSIPVGLLVQSLNDMIDLHTRRLILRAGHVPEPAWWLLFGILLISTCTVGYNGAHGTRNHLGLRIALATALAVTFALALDLDRPTRGVIRIREVAMRDLVESMQK